MRIFKNAFKSLAMKCQVHKQLLEEQFHHVFLSSCLEANLSGEHSLTRKKSTSPPLQQPMYSFLQDGTGNSYKAGEGIASWVHIAWMRA